MAKETTLTRLSSGPTLAYCAQVCSVSLVAEPGKEIHLESFSNHPSKSLCCEILDPGALARPAPVLRYWGRETRGLHVQGPGAWGVFHNP